MSRLRSNCNVTLVTPRELEDVISVTDAMRPNWRSSGVATEEAMVSGLAPGNDALTEMVGKSTWGRGETGSRRKATAPARAIAIIRSVVATGLRMNNSEKFMTLPATPWLDSRYAAASGQSAWPYDRTINKLLGWYTG